MEIKDIQANLNETIAKKAEEEFRQAMNKVSTLLQPFFGDCIKDGELDRAARVEAMGKLMIKCCYISGRGNVIFGNNIKAPAEYVIMRQSEASAYFIKRVEELQADVEELYSSIER